MTFPRYANYKPSGVEWLGELPGHWGVLKLRRVISKIEQGWSPECHAYEADENGWGVLKAGCLNGGVFRASENKALPPGLVPETAYEVQVGDVLMSRASGSPELVGSTALIASTRKKLMLSDKIFRLTLNELVVKEFFVAALNSRPLRVQIENMLSGGNGMANNLPQSSMRELVIPIPSEAEQTSIAAFLDRETAKIDALIAEQANLIALLAEKRQATISQAVTRGLNPDAPMKDSGVAWLGEVPAHWGLARVRQISQFTTSGPRGWSDRISEDGSLFIQSGDITDEMGLDFDGAKRVAVDDDAEAARTALANGDVVVCITGAKTGNVALCHSLPEPAYVNQHLCLIRPSSEVHPRFLALVLKSGVGKTQLELSQYGLKQGLSLENIRDLLVPLPPLVEQHAISERLVAIEAGHAALTTDSVRAVQLLRERRAALIAAAVTGQIDVRQAVAAATI